MKTLEKGQEKIKKICAVLRDETLEPAQKEAQSIIANAQEQAEQILLEAHQAAEKLHADAKAAIEQERQVFEASLRQSAKQSLETLRQSIESKFFNEHLQELIEQEADNPHLVANLINSLVEILNKEGLSADLTAFVGKKIAPRDVNKLLVQDVLNALQGNSVTIGNFHGGIQLKLQNKRMTIDISEKALKELLATHLVRKDFRKLLFDLAS